MELANLWGRIPFNQDWQRSNIDPAVKEILTKLYGKYPEFSVSSGYRSPSYNKKIGGARRSEHTHGRAADIQLPSSWTEEQKSNFLTDALNSGFKRVIGYDKYPGMFHLDTNPKFGDNYFMWNKSSKNMGAAPGWYQRLAGGIPNVPSEPGTPGVRPDGINDFGFSNAIKARFDGPLPKFLGRVFDSQASARPYSGGSPGAQEGPGIPSGRPPIVPAEAASGALPVVQAEDILRGRGLDVGKANAYAPALMKALMPTAGSTARTQQGFPRPTPKPLMSPAGGGSGLSGLFSKLFGGIL